MSPTRDYRLDLVKGIALLMIFIDHVPSSILSYVTLQSFAFNDAAELFFFTSGYVAALVYGRTLREQGFAAAMARIYRRGSVIYAAQIILLVLYISAVAAIVWLTGSEEYIGHFRTGAAFSQPASAALHGLLLRFQPVYLDILPVYFLFFLLLPFVLVVLRRNVWIALALSVAIYLGVQLGAWQLSTFPYGGAWFFRPLAWQFIFVLGAAFGSGALTVPDAGRARWLPVVAWCIVGFGALVIGSLTLHEVIPSIPSLLFVPLPNDKSTLGILRVVNFLALAWLARHYLPPGDALMRNRWAHALIDCGQHSLPVFCEGVILAVASHVLWLEWQSGWLQFAFTLFGIACSLALARVLENRKKLARKASSAPEDGARALT